MSGFNPAHFLRLLQAVFAVISLALFASVSSYYSSLPAAFNSTPASLAYPIFVSTLTLLLSLPFFIISTNYFPKLANKYAIFTVEFGTCILWVAAWIAPAAYLGQLSVCKGAICTCAKVGIVFSVMESIAFGITAWFAGLYCFGSNATGSNEEKGRKSGSLSNVSISRPMPVITTGKAEIEV